MSTQTPLWVLRNGQRFGPIPLSEVIAGIQRERFQLHDLGWHEGMKEWKALSDIPRIRDELAQHLTLQRPLPKFPGVN